MYTESIAQAIGIPDILNNQSIAAAGSAQSAGIDMSKFRRAGYIVQLETTTGGVLSGHLEASATSNFATVVNLAGTNLTNMNTNNTQQLVEVRADQVAQAGNNLRYVRLNLGATTAACTANAVGIGKDPVQHPASQNNVNTVVAEVACSL